MIVVPGLTGVPHWLATHPTISWALVVLSWAGMVLGIGDGAPASGTERAAWILTIGGAIVLIGNRIVDLVITFRQKWIAADKDTDHERWAECADREARKDARIKELEGEIARCYVVFGQKDEQNTHLITDKAILLDNNSKLLAAHAALQAQYAKLAASVSMNNARILDRLDPVAAPVRVAIDPASQPVPVREVEDGGSAPLKPPGTAPVSSPPGGPP